MPVLQRASYRKGRKRGNADLIPTVMLQNERNQIYVQLGNFFGPGGRQIESPPDWALDQIKAMPKEAQARLGFETKRGKLGALTVKPEPEPEPELELDPDA